jgi:ribosomal protein S18 acetylase RimI-like enzyme/catechol 2,3-dioxygenase-like lactoylglutathione lyase family enzyme
LDIKIQIAGEEKGEICNKILRALPEWFEIESAIVDYVKEVKAMETWTAFVEGEVVGFISVKKHNPFTAEVYVMGILEKYHRMNIGRQLLRAAEDYLIKENFKFLQVKTLSENRPNAFYDKTRQFYLNTGFLPVEEFKTLWGEHNPCLLMIKSLSSEKTNGLLSHIEINVSNYSKSIQFYDRVLFPFGWKRIVCQQGFTSYSDGSMKLILSPVESKFGIAGYHRKNIGLNHLALYATSRKSVDDFYSDVLLKNNISCLYKETPEGDNTYYAVFFEDPDRIKIEIVYSPEYCSKDHWTNTIKSDFDPYMDLKT